ncbi:MAG TPA: TonB-dependent receptor plug domain-containing protein [Novosphingobium sp.]|nr:TonB-dependent receptor plug domain-containing protein [Novosphingobium sp.]
MSATRIAAKVLVAVGALALTAGQVHAAQADAAAAEGTTPPADSAAQVFTPDYFTRFAPRTALDMVQQVPGFQIRESEQLRGLGQATGNVLINGKRLSSKSDDIFTQLQRIPAGNVVRIEIADGASLDLPGLSGQVANIIAKSDSTTGQFEWNPAVRIHAVEPFIARGSVSVSGKTGAVDYSVTIANRGGLGAAVGPTYIYDAAGSLIELRNDTWNNRYQEPGISGRTTIDGPGDSVINLNAQYKRFYEHYREKGFRDRVTGVDRGRTVSSNADGWNYELGGDVEFGMGPGKLKLIGLNRRAHEPYVQTVITTPVDGSAPFGDRYSQVGEVGERIVRGEYTFKTGKSDWQLSGEAAFNSLDNAAALFTLDPAGNFVPVPFPDGTGGVRESRYEGLLSYGRPLSSKLTLQIVAGAESSRIAQTGPLGQTRSFFRPKGSLSLAWRPSATFDVSLKLRRRVLQLSFYDFLARVFLDNENANAGNNELVPQQDWSLEIEANKKLGRWGSTKLQLIGRLVEDYVDIVPIGLTGESVGNIPHANAQAIDWTSTILLDPIGWKGAKVDVRLLLQHSSLRDPLTGERRQYSGFTDRLVELGLRHDIPGSDWAWGFDLFHQHNQPSFRLNEVGTQHEGPWWGGVFVENKDVGGLTVRLDVRNLTDARSYWERTVYAGRRNASPVAFYERRNRLIGPIFNLTVKGSF